jgi:hypothetical protein
MEASTRGLVKGMPTKKTTACYNELLSLSNRVIL